MVSLHVTRCVGLRFAGFCALPLALGLPFRLSSPPLGPLFGALGISLRLSAICLVVFFVLFVVFALFSFLGRVWLFVSG